MVRSDSRYRARTSHRHIMPGTAAFGARAQSRARTLHA